MCSRIFTRCFGEQRKGAPESDWRGGVTEHVPVRGLVWAEFEGHVGIRYTKKEDRRSKGTWWLIRWWRWVAQRGLKWLGCLVWANDWTWAPCMEKGLTGDMRAQSKSSHEDQAKLEPLPYICWEERGISIRASVSKPEKSGGVRQRTRAAPGAATAWTVHRCSWPLLPPPHGLTNYTFLPVCSLCFGPVSKMFLRKLWLQSHHSVQVRKLRCRDSSCPRAENRQAALIHGPRASPWYAAWFWQKQQSLFLEAQAFQRQALSHWDIISPDRSSRRQMLRGIPSLAAPLTHLLCYKQKAYFNARTSLVHLASPS